MRLADRVAVITGAGSGIGRAMALRFAAEGARVVVADLLKERVDEVVDELRRASATVLGLSVDVSRSSDVDRLIDAAVAQFGRLDVLCNNAGIMDRMLAVADVPDELWERVLAVNLTGPFLACRRAVSIMLRQGRGVIINTASVAGLRGARAGAAYTASKYGVIGLTKNIASIYGDDGIRCNAICPGAVRTRVLESAEPESEFGRSRTRDRLWNTRPRTAEPEEIASVAAFLASDDASYVNGAEIVVDGGFIAF